MRQRTRPHFDLSISFHPQLYMVTKFSKERTTNGEGIEVVKNEPYEDEKGKGQYTHKLVHIGRYE